MHLTVLCIDLQVNGEGRYISLTLYRQTPQIYYVSKACVVRDDLKFP